MRDLNDRVAVITGASSGIGRATALALAREGMRLHLVARREHELGKACEKAREYGVPVAVHVQDVCDAHAMKALAERIVESEGRVDLLFNNAGAGVAKKFLDTTEDDWRWLMDLNVFGVVHGVQAFLPHMLERGEGLIINTASLGGLAASQLAAYSTSKFAVVGLSESLLVDYGNRGIRVMVVCPGMVATEMVQASIDSGRHYLPTDPDGAKFKALLERRGAAPETIAKDIVRGVKRGRFLVVTPTHARMLWSIRKWFPAVARWLTRLLEKEMERQ
jgi:NAD(P)-dependent dehydrogenase (short-subunit alcohol dehydrogenase family)